LPILAAASEVRVASGKACRINDVLVSIRVVESLRFRQFNGPELDRTHHG